MVASLSRNRRDLVAFCGFVSPWFVGFVCFSAVGPDGAITRSPILPGARFDVRDRSTTVAMHLVRRLLLGEHD